MNQLQEKVRRYMTDKKEYRRENLRYMLYEMKMLDQEDLISWLKEMNLKELQYCQGAGIPGHANTVALELIRERKKRMAEYLEGKGSEMITDLKVERPQEQDASISVDENGEWDEEAEAINEGDEDAKQPVHTSKKGRESDSEAL